MTFKLNPKPRLTKLWLAMKEKRQGSYEDEEYDSELELETQQKESTMKNIQTKSDPQAEDIIKSLGLKFTMRPVPYAQIDIAAGITNLAKITSSGTGKAIDPELVSRYAGAMQQGNIFPSPVLVRIEGKSYFPAGGNQRLEAWKQAFGPDYEVESYIVDGTDDEARDVLPRMLNNRHGAATPLPVALDNAAYVVRTYNWTICETEKRFSIRKGLLKDHLYYLSTKEEIAQAGLNPNTLPKTSVERLATLRNNKHVFEEACRLAIRSRLNSDAVDQVVKAVRKEKTEATQIGAIGQFEKDFLPRSNESTPELTKRPVRIQFLGALKRFENAVDRKTKLSQFQITTQDEKTSVSRRLQNLIARLTQICASIKATR